MTDEYITRCGWWSVDTKPFSTVCGLDTEYRNGKCVSTVDITSDNINPASVCGLNTEYRNGKCIPTASVCGHLTVWDSENGKCNVKYSDARTAYLKFRNDDISNEKSIKMHFLNSIPKSLTVEATKIYNETVSFEEQVAGTFLHLAKDDQRLRGNHKGWKLKRLMNCFVHESEKYKHTHLLPSSEYFFRYGLVSDNHHRRNLVTNSDSIYNKCMSAL